MPQTELALRNPVTSNLEGTRYQQDEYTTTHFVDIGDRGNVAVIYFSGQSDPKSKGMSFITVPGMRELSSRLEAMATDPTLFSAIWTENNDPSIGQAYTSFPGINIRTEFAPAFNGIPRGDFTHMQIILETGQKLVEQMMQFPKPLVGIFGGDIYGGGMELMDPTYSIMGTEAHIALPECGLDVPEFLGKSLEIDPTRIKDPHCLFPGWHGQRSTLYRMIERGANLEEAIQINETFVFHGMVGKLTADEALARNMVDAIGPTDQLYDAAIDYMRTIDGFSPRTLGIWEAPQIPESMVERKTIGRIACHNSLYNNSGSWREVGEFDSLLMLSAMAEGLGATNTSAYEGVVKQLEAA